jgi:GGDEF domain-containing protein
VLINHRAAEAKVSLDRLRAAVAAREGVFPPVSLSIGVAEYDGVGRYTIEGLIEAADAAMYTEKQARKALAPMPPAPGAAPEPGHEKKARQG